MTQSNTVNPAIETIYKLSPRLKDLVHSSFEEAKKITTQASLDPMSESYIPADNLTLQKNFRKSLIKRLLSSSEIDSQILKLYIPALRDSFEQRSVTAIMKLYLVQFTDFITWINIWYNHEQGQRFSLTMIADIKSVTSENTKLLLDSAEKVFTENSEAFSFTSKLVPPHLRDLFRCQCICNSDVSSLKRFIQIILLILNNPDSEEYNAFWKWVSNDTQKYGGLPIPKEKLLKFKHFKFDTYNEKNYIDAPKGAYRAWHVIINILEAPDDMLELAGKEFELQILTWDMFECSKIGSAAHDEYKKAIYELSKELFPLDGYQQEFYCTGLDINGLNEHVSFYTRQSSGNSIPKIQKT